jgi:catechol 2,3-dioxygenase-like lactoylglutathione lyase family enzyme
MSEINGGFGLSAIGQIAVNVHDLDRAVAFYRDVLGMSFLFQAPPNLAFFSCGDVRIMLDVAQEKEFDHPASILYYRVDDVREGYRILSSRGVKFMGEPHVIHRTETYELWMAFFRDPDENVLALMAEVSIQS